MTEKQAQSAAPHGNPLDQPFDAPMSAIPGIDVDVEEETNRRVWGAAYRVRRRRAESEFEFERVTEYADWRDDARRELRFSMGHARTTHRISDRLDSLLGLPGAVWLWAAYDQNGEIAFMAVACWIGALLIWTPWSLWRVRARNPKGDVARAGRFLAGAWALLVVLIPAAASLTSLLAAFAVVYAGGLLLVYLALAVPPARAKAS